MSISDKFIRTNFNVAKFNFKNDIQVDIFSQTLAYKNNTNAISEIHIHTIHATASIHIDV